MISIWIYFISLIAITLCSFHFSRNWQGNELRLELTPSLFLATTFFLYSSAMPISRIFFASPPQSGDLGYMWPHLLGAIGIALGQLLARVLIKNRAEDISQPPTQEKAIRVLPSILVSLFLLAIVLYLLLDEAGWSLTGLLSPYGFQAESYADWQRTSPIYSGIAGHVLLTCIAFIFAAAPPRSLLRRFASILAGFVGSLFIIRGYRNAAILLAIPLFALLMRGKRLKLWQYIGTLLLAFLFLYPIGIIRAYGFSRISEALSEFSTAQYFDPLYGELGANHSVFTKWELFPSDQDLLLGKSYTIDVLINLVPRALWPDRPDGVAIRFSKDYFGKLDLTEGLGFSPMVEAIMNFGRAGILPTFLFLSLLLRVFETWLKRKSVVGITCYAFLFPIVLNWNRIDFATASKMYLLFVLVAYLLSKIISQPRKVGRHANLLP